MLVYIRYECSSSKTAQQYSAIDYWALGDEVNNGD